MKPVAFALFFLAAQLFAQQSSAIDPPKNVLDSVTAQGIRARMRFLSDDLLEGRDTGSRGQRIATKYVASRFEEMGIKPAGVNGTYFQEVPFRTITLVPAETSLTIKQNGGEKKLVLGQDYITRGHDLQQDVSVEAPVVFAGYGVTAPHLKYDDYSGADVHGKIVAIFYGAPPAFDVTDRAHFSSMREKLANAVAHGAVGVINLWTPDREKRFAFSRAGRDLDRPSFRWLNPKGEPSDAQPTLQAQPSLSIEAARSLFAGASKTYDQAWADAKVSKPQPFPLPVTMAMRTVSRFGEVTSPNVVAVLEGSDPKLRDEYVVYTAHLDHLGIGTPVNGDSIYNGARDNASGVAAMLEIARAFTRLPKAPRRSIMFVTVTGEEKGLLGSDYFAHYPTVPIKQIVADVNMDEIPFLYDFRDVVALGAEHSSLGKVVEHVAKVMNLSISPDPQPDEVYFIRSDQYSFVRQGVPAVNIDAGFKAVDPSTNAEKVSDDWERERYHQPSDDMSQPLSYPAALKCTDFDLRIGYMVAQENQRPEWNRGDFFGEQYGKGR